jgi:hypothetical protein
MIQLGDEIEFSENDKPEIKVSTRVKGLLRYQFFKDLFADHEPSLFVRICSFNLRIFSFA